MLWILWMVHANMTFGKNSSNIITVKNLSTVHGWSGAPSINFAAEEDGSYNFLRQSGFQPVWPGFKWLFCRSVRCGRSPELLFSGCCLCPVITQLCSSRIRPGNNATFPLHHNTPLGTPFRNSQWAGRDMQVVSLLWRYYSIRPNPTWRWRDVSDPESIHDACWCYMEMITSVLSLLLPWFSTFVSFANMNSLIQNHLIWESKWFTCTNCATRNVLCSCSAAEGLSFLAYTHWVEQVYANLFSWSS